MKSLTVRLVEKGFRLVNTEKCLRLPSIVPAPNSWIHVPYQNPHYFRYPNAMITQRGGYAPVNQVEDAARMFNFNADIHIEYPERFSTLIGDATWTVQGSGSDWFPAEWDRHFSRRQGETLRSLEVIRNGGHGFFEVIGGRRPLRLFLCRICQRRVFNTAYRRNEHQHACIRHQLDDLLNDDEDSDAELNSGEDIV